MSPEPPAADPAADPTADGPPDPPVSRRRRVLRRTGTVVLGIVAVVSIAALLAFVIVPRLAGATPYTVLTGSMQPDIPPGSVVVVREVPFDQIAVGDVITYQIASGRPEVVTHRVVAVDVTPQGERRLRTQGDANASADAEPVRAEQLRGEVWYHAPWVGYVSQAAGPELRATLARIAGVLLLAWAAYLLVSALLSRRRRASAAD